MSSMIVRPLPYIPPKYERKEMTLQEKKDFYSMPIDDQLYHRQFNPALGEPEIKKPDDDADEHAWFSKPPCVLVPSAERLPPPRVVKYGAVELRAWENYLQSQPLETRTYILSIIASEQMQRRAASARERRRGDERELERASRLEESAQRGAKLERRRE
ncbi:hypothetical protein Tco_1141850 [Tanacetum coccineum]